MNGVGKAANTIAVSDRVGKVKVRIMSSEKSHGGTQNNPLNRLGLNAGTAIQALVDQHPKMFPNGPIKKTALRTGNATWPNRTKNQCRRSISKI